MKKLPLVTHVDKFKLNGLVKSSHSDCQYKHLIDGSITNSKDLMLGYGVLPNKNSSLQIHRHEPCELYYFLSGIGKLMIDDEYYDVKTGSSAYLPSMCLHGVQNLSYTPLTFLYIFGITNFDDIKYLFE